MRWAIKSSASFSREPSARGQRVFEGFEVTRARFLRVMVAFGAWGPAH
jgi:hypothetical protein